MNWTRPRRAQEERGACRNRRCRRTAETSAPATSRIATRVSRFADPCDWPRAESRGPFLALVGSASQAQLAPTVRITSRLGEPEPCPVRMPQRSVGPMAAYRRNHSRRDRPSSESLQPLLSRAQAAFVALRPGAREPEKPIFTWPHAADQARAMTARQHRAHRGAVADTPVAAPGRMRRDCPRRCRFVSVPRICGCRAHRLRPRGISAANAVPGKRLDEARVR